MSTTIPRRSGAKIGFGLGSRVQFFRNASLKPQSLTLFSVPDVFGIAYELMDNEGWTRTLSISLATDADAVTLEPHSMKPNNKFGRSINASGMAFAPTYELGVVFLFGHLAARLGFDVEIIRPQFPDCLAKRKGKPCRIEFELWASSYANHPANGADVIVCWENDWEGRPKAFQHLEIIDLKKYVGAPRRVFVVGCTEQRQGKELDSSNTIEWNVPAIAQVDDLIVMFRAGKGASQIKDIWKLVGPFKSYGKQNKLGRWPGLQAGLRKVANLTKPLTYTELTNDKVMRRLPVVRKRFNGKTNITEDWPLFYQRIVQKNPKVKRALKDY